MVLAAVILAAGASTRMGTTKALLKWKGRYFFHHLCDLAADVGCTPIVVVSGASELPREKNYGLLGMEHFQYIQNKEWKQGQLSSLQAGIAHLVSGSRVEGVLVLTVDRPHLKRSTVRTLVDFFEMHSECIVQPCYHSSHSTNRKKQSHGHPLIYPAWACQELLAYPSRGSAREWLRLPKQAPFRRFVSVDDAAILENIDTPQDLQCLQ